jgi:hypothetical protein
MNRAACLSGIVMAGTIVVGCGGSDDEVKLGSFGAEASRSICDKVYECCMPTDVELAAHMNYSGGREACGTKTEKSTGFWAAIIGKEQERGRLSYDGKLARRCLTAFGAATCEAHKSNQPLDGCDTFITPKTPPGAACNAHESCVGGSCGGLTAEHEGVCRAFVGEGASCASDPCGKGLFCEGSAKICKPRKPNGESCNLHGECQSEGCNGRNPDAGTAGTCGLKGGEQTRCFVTSGCAFAGGQPRGGGGALGALGLLALGTLLYRARRSPRRTVRGGPAPARGWR